MIGLTAPAFLKPVGVFLKPLAAPLIAAAVCVFAGWYVLDMRADLTTAESANVLLNAQLATAERFNSRLAASVEIQAASAELFGRRVASVQATLSETLEALAHEPQTTLCLESPASRVGLDGLRAQWRAYDAAGLSSSRAGDIAPTP